MPERAKEQWLTPDGRYMYVTDEYAEDLRVFWEFFDRQIKAELPRVLTPEAFAELYGPESE